MEHYFSEKPQSKKSYGLVTATLRGRQYEFMTCSGVFSWREIDNGARLLIDKMRVSPADRVLDIGCGYGPIGIVAASLAPQGSVVLSDINYRAFDLAKKNITRNGIKNAEACHSNLFTRLEREFNTILTNPPYLAGLETIYRFISESKQHLYPGGTLQLVGRHNKGGSRAEEKMHELFGNCETLGKRGGFRVYIAKNER